MMLNQYKATIECMTFNQKDYIEQTLRGFVMQETSFPYLTVLVDDASTDGNREVIQQFLMQEFVAETDFAIVPEDKHATYAFVQHKTNKNCHLLFIDLKRNLYQEQELKTSIYEPYLHQGKYIALCEGDDYWTDPLKLQKQVDILEADETLMGCVTNCSVVDMKGAVLEEKRIQPVVRDNKQGRYSLRDFFDQGHQYPTLSAVYRNTHREEVSEKCQTMRNPFMGDWTMWIALLCFGDFYYLDEVTCAYRINPTSLTHDQSKMNARRLGQAKDNFRLLPLVASVLPDEYKDIKDDLTYNTAWMWFKLAIAYKKTHQYGKMLYALLRCELKSPGFVWREMRKIRIEE